MSKAPVLSSEIEYARTEQKAETPSIPVTEIGDYYYVDLIAENIRTNGYKSVCLQFPDNLIRDSTYVASLIQAQVDAKVFVLADTSYSPCCVDEIAAQHVRGDVVFHFGDACLNASRSLPVVYVQHKNFRLKAETIMNQIKSSENENSDQTTDRKIIVYPDTNFANTAAQLCSVDISVAMPAPEKAVLIPEHDISNAQSFEVFPNRKVISKTDINEEDISQYELVYLSDSPSESLLLYWSTVFSSIRIINGNGEESSSVPALIRRYRNVQTIKSAGTIGILVNTLSLKDSIPLLERMRSAITQAEKKYYTFVVGKPNVAKLGNFEVVDVWVVLGCPQGGMIMDDDEYIKPIVTPYELQLAFNDEWTGKWLLQFKQVLNDVIVPKKTDEPLFDLVTGKFAFGNTPLREMKEITLNDKEVQLSSNSLTIRNTVSTAAKTLQEKSWQGLGSDHGDIHEESAELKKGRTGIARNYGEMK